MSANPFAAKGKCLQWETLAPRPTFFFLTMAQRKAKEQRAKCFSFVFLFETPSHKSFRKRKHSSASASAFFLFCSQTNKRHSDSIPNMLLGSAFFIWAPARDSFEEGESTSNDEY
jgi:hypothetical protein